MHWIFIFLTNHFDKIKIKETLRKGNKTVEDRFIDVIRFDLDPEKRERN